MEVLLNIEEVRDHVENLDDPKAEETVRKAVGLQEKDSVACVNIGPGADVLVLMIVFKVTWTIFQLPGNLKKSLEGWEWLVNKLKSFAKKKELVSLDLDSAGLFAIDYLAEKYGDDSSFNLLDAHCFKIHDISGMYPNNKDILAAHPHNYYVFTFYIADRILVMSVRSTGEIRELEAFIDMPYGLLDFKE